MDDSVYVATHAANWSTAVAVSKRIILGRTVMVRTGRKREWHPFGGVLVDRKSVV